jgi:hypothetical protein
MHTECEWKNVKGRDNLEEEQDIEGRVILKWMKEK